MSALQADGALLKMKRSGLLCLLDELVQQENSQDSRAIAGSG
ncbi:MAG: hypothetical protein R3E67_07475 [Pseudomonadales bacterium]